MSILKIVIDDGKPTKKCPSVKTFLNIIQLNFSKLILSDLFRSKNIIYIENYFF